MISNAPRLWLLTLGAGLLVSPWMGAAAAGGVSGTLSLTPALAVAQSDSAPTAVTQPEPGGLTEGQALLRKRWVPRWSAVTAAATQAAAANTPAAPATDNAIRVLLEPLGFTTLSSPLDGRILEVGTSIGKRFAKGAVLVSFDCQEQKSRLSISRTELRGATEKYRTQLLMKGLDQASEIDVRLAALDVEKNKSQVELFSFQVRQCTVLAPWEGSAAKVHVRPFMSVNKGAPLLDLVRSGRLKARMNVPSKWLGSLKLNAPVKVAVDETQKRYGARITAINSRVDAVSQTVEVEATMETDFKDLIPGMSGVVRFEGLR